MKKKSVTRSAVSKNVDKALIDNFIALQKVMTNLSVKFDGLTHQISKLLDLFEISAKALAEKDFELEKSNRENAKLLEKIENVLEQNKTIARGLTLMHDRINEPKYTSQIPETAHRNIQQGASSRPASEESMRLMRLRERQKALGGGRAPESFKHFQPPSNEQ